MFEGLQEKLESVIHKAKGYGKITEENISEMLREVRIALLEADVNYKVVKEFTNSVKEKALGEEVITSLKPGELFVKIVSDELKELLEDGDVEVLKEINIALKKSNIIKATPDIKQWLIEVMNELRKNKIADYLVIFWDEFTSLLEISERRSILNCMQDIAELSKAPRKDDKDKFIGV